MVFYKINNHRVTKEFYAIVKSQCYKENVETIYAERRKQNNVFRNLFIETGAFMHLMCKLVK